MKLLNLKIISFWFIVGLSYCLPISILADCKEAFPKREKTNNPPTHGKNSQPVQRSNNPENVFHSLVESSLTKILKPESLEKMELQTCGTGCVKLVSNTSINFEIKTDSRISSPEFHTDGQSKTFKVPSLDFFQDPSMGNKLRYWLVGHELHPYFSEGKIMMKPVQELALFAYQQARRDDAKSFLHIGPTGIGKTLILTKALLEHIKHFSKEKNIAIATVNRVHLVDQISKAIKTEIAESSFSSSRKEDNALDIQVINWNNHTGDRFAEVLSQASRYNGPTIFVITTQSLKQILKDSNTEHYKQLASNLSAIFIDEAHHLGAKITKEVLLNLQEQSGAFLYGTTATPIHHQVSLRSLFEKTYWSYLNIASRFFENYSSEGIIGQLSEGIKRGDLTPFDNLYFIADTLFKTNEKIGDLFISEYKNNRKILNPDFYETLARILYPVLKSNEKGFIVTATIREADRLTEFLRNVFPEIQFDSYHQRISSENKSKIIKRSHEKGKTHYIVAVRSLDEGIDLPHLSAYIDLNVNIPIKKMLQRIGRVLRLKSGKFSSDIILLIDYRDEQIARELLNILDIIKTVSFSQTIRGSVKEAEDTESAENQISPNLPNRHIFEREDLSEFRTILEESVRQFWNGTPSLSLVTKKNLPPLEEFLQVIEQKGIKTQREYIRQRQLDPELRRFPSEPEVRYENFKWPGRNHITELNIPPLEEFLQVIEQKGIKTQWEYQTQRKIDPELTRFPSRPEVRYKDFKWPGTQPKVTKKNLPPLEEFLQVIEQKEIKTQREYQTQRKIDPELRQRFPFRPEKIYKDFKWPGRNHITESNIPSLEEFLHVVFEQKGIRTQWKYITQRKIDMELKRFPDHPEKQYKDFKWQRRHIVTKSNLPPLEEFLKVIEEKDIRTNQEYKIQRQLDPELRRFPSEPKKQYKNFTWPGRKRVTELNLPPLEEFLQVIEQKDIKTQKEYIRQRQLDPKLKRFPSQPEKQYKDFKWPGRHRHQVL